MKYRVRAEGMCSKYRVRVEAMCSDYKVKGYLGAFFRYDQEAKIVVRDNELIKDFNTREEAEECMVNYMVKNRFPDIEISIEQHVNES